MKCPKCEEGDLLKIILKLSSEKATLCDYCSTLWLTGEEISASTGHDYYTFGNHEYMIDDSEDKDQDHTTPKYTNIK